MELIVHCIIDTNTNMVVNVVEYETEQTGTPSGMEDNFIAVRSDEGAIGGTYANGIVTNPVVEEEV